MQYYNFIRNFYLKMHFEEFQRKQSYVQLKPNNHISKAGMKAVFRYILIHRTFEGINIQRGMYVLFYIIYIIQIHQYILKERMGQLSLKYLVEQWLLMYLALKYHLDLKVIFLFLLSDISFILLPMNLTSRSKLHHQINNMAWHAIAHCY